MIEIDVRIIHEKVVWLNSLLCLVRMISSMARKKYYLDW